MALGDSLTEGVGDPHLGHPNGLRGWADLLAAHLATLDPDTEYANLALRGRRARDVLVEQVPAAVEMRPTVATLWAGGNDLLRPVVDVDEVADSLRSCLVPLRRCGARVIVFTGFELTLSPVLAPARARAARLNARLVALAERYDVDLVDVSSFAQWSADALLAPDRVHPSPVGHRHIAHRVAHVLGSPFPDPLALTGAPTARPGIRARWGEERRWWLGEVLPHVRRWAEGAAASEAVAAKWAVPVRPAGPRTLTGPDPWPVEPWSGQPA